MQYMDGAGDLRREWYKKYMFCDSYETKQSLYAIYSKGVNGCITAPSPHSMSELHAHHLQFSQAPQ